MYTHVHKYLFLFAVQGVHVRHYFSSSSSVLELFFELFRCQDKTLRSVSAPHMKI